MISECSNCAAPLDVTATSNVVRCAYCGHKNQVRQMRVVYQQRPMGWRPMQQWVPPAHSRVGGQQLTFNPGRHARSVLIATLLPIVLTTVIPLVAFFGPQLKSLVFPWDGKKQFVCSGNDDLELSGVKVKAKTSPAIIVEVNCELHISDSKITAENLIEVRGNGQVVIENSTLTATGARGVSVDENGSLELVSSKLRVRPKGTTAKVVGIDAGGNRFIKLNKSSLELRASRASGAIVVARIDGNKELQLRDSTIRVRGAPKPGAIALLALDGNATADIQGGKIDAGGRVVSVSAVRKVTISGTQIKAKVKATADTDLTVD